MDFLRRHGKVLLVLALLAATATAFAIAEKVKLEESPIAGPRVTDLFSPVCKCETARATISFRLRRRDRLTIGVVDSRDELIRTLVADRLYPPGRIELTWDGRDSDGRVLREGIYRPRVDFVDRGRKIVFENLRIKIDTVPPGIAPVGVRPRRFSPDGDRRRDGIAVRYVLVHGPGRAILLVDGVQRVYGRARVRESGQLQWYGVVDGTPLPPGRYRLTLVGEDLAGNRSRRVDAGTVVIRYVELAERAVKTRVGRRFSVHVRTDAASFRWRFAGRTGVARPPLLTLTARLKGRHALVVETHGHEARTLVTVKPKPKPKKRKKTAPKPQPAR